MASTAVIVMWTSLFVVLFFGAMALCTIVTSHCLRVNCIRDLPPAPRRPAPLRPRERLVEDGGTGDCEAPPPQRQWVGVIVENPSGEKMLGKM
jgi:hypothetical protein